MYNTQMLYSCVLLLFLSLFYTEWNFIISIYHFNNWKQKNENTK